MSTPKLTVVAGGQTAKPHPTLKKKGGTPAKYAWTAEAIDMARAAGFYWESRIAGALAPHVARDGWDWVQRVWRAYLNSRPYLNWDLDAAAGRARGEPVKDIRFVTPTDFANNYGYWDLRVTPQHLKPIKQQQHLTGDLSTPPERPAA